MKVKKNYGACLSKYKIPEDALPVSGLGDGGILFISSTEFEE